MATEDVDMDDDKWLYGDDIDGNSPEQSDAVVEALLGDDGGVREGTPDLDEIEATSGLGLGQAPIKASEKPPELQLITLQQQNAEPQTTKDQDETIEDKEMENGKDEESSDSDDDDDDVKITIGTLNTTSAYARPGFGRMLPLPGTGGETVIPVKKVDLDAVPQINGVPLPELDLDESIADKPWRKPGADVTDYFNYGFTEDTWRLYCEKQRKMRQEVNQLNKFVVSTSISMAPRMDNKSMYGYTSMDLPPHSQSISLPMMPPMMSNVALDNTENDLENLDERGTPPPDAGILPPKIPILPPPGLPPLPFPPQDVSAAAAMAAMFTGGPPPPLRPPDFHPGFPPPMPGGMPHFPPPMPGDMRPPFLPPGFSMGEPPRGPITLDDPRAVGMFNPDMGFPPPWGDPSMGTHPDVMAEFNPPNVFGRGSRSPSRSSSNSSRGSSVERRNASRRDKSSRDKYDSNRSSHHRTRRSRSRDRSHHRSTRRDHNRDHRDRERDRERERRSERHEKERRERRRRDERRHERTSTKRRRSRTPEGEEEPPATREKRSRSRSASQ